MKSPTASTGFPLLPRAPIVEALIDLRAEVPPTTTIDRLASLGERLGSRYPRKVEQKAKSVEVKVGPGGASLVREGDPGVLGYAFHSSDGRQVVQIRRDGLTLNRLNPYPGWEPLREEARSVWTEYERIASPLRVTRLAIRTINRIELPLPVANLKEFFRTAPDIAPGVPREMAEFFLRVVLREPGHPAVAIVTQGLEAVPPGATRAPVIFDVDVFQEGADPPGSPEVWDRLEGLRGLKNRIFFESLTERALDLFR